MELIRNLSLATSFTKPLKNIGTKIPDPHISKCYNRIYTVIEWLDGLLG